MSKSPKALEVVSDIPIPNTRGLQYGKWPFREMKIGDSFFAPLEQAGAAGQIVRPAVSWFSKRNPGFLFVTRKTDGGFRVWRIKERAQCMT